MHLTITLPDHVAAAFSDADEAAAWCLAAATDHAREQALAAARDEANRVLAAAAAEWDGTEPPTVPTLAEQVAAVDQRIDRVPGLAVVAVSAALDQVAAITEGTPVEQAKAAAVAAVVEAIESR